MVTLPQLLAAAETVHRKKKAVILPMPGKRPTTTLKPGDEVKPPAKSRLSFKPDIPFSKYQARIKKRLLRALDAYQSGDMSLEEFETRVKTQLDVAYEYAFASGAESKVLSEGDAIALAKIKTSEFNYLDGFIDDMVSGKGIMPLDRRLGMYADSLTQAFWTGHVRSADQDTQFNWVTTPGENCEDCLDLEDGGPYSKGELTTVPGAGDTVCGSHCNCFLEPVGED